MVTLPLNNLEYLDSKRFEYFCLDFMNQLNNIDFNKRGINGQGQGGFDLISVDGKIRVECKQYSNITTSNLKTFIEKFEEANQNNLNNIDKLIFCFSCKFENENLLKILEDKNIEYKKRNLSLNIEYKDASKISTEIYTNNLFGLVSRYFSRDILKDFWGDKKFNQYYGSFDKINHYYNELFVGHSFPFLCEISENIFEKGNIFINNGKLEEIDKYLNEKKVCLIRASEGRGKTVMSRLIAFQKYKANFDVFFIDLKSNISASQIDHQFTYWADKPQKHTQKYLIVIENAHGYSELDLLLNNIGKWIKGCENLYFLLNTRYAEKTDYLTFWSKDFTVKLFPSKEDIVGIIELYERVCNEDNNEIQERKAISPDKLNDFINEKIYINTPDKSKNIEGANLRLLNIYLDTWKDNKNGIYLNNIDEQLILDRFSTKYNLDDLEPKDIETLLYFSAIYQFDVPYYVNKNDDNYIFLEKFHRVGFCYKRGDNFHLAHSVDAQYLCKSICRKQEYDYFEKSSELVKNYIDVMLNNPSSIFTSNFIQIIKELVKKDFNELLNELCDISTNKWAKKILTRLNIGFFNIIFTRCIKIGKMNEVMEFYIENKDEFKDKFLQTNHIIVAAINNCLKKYYKYNSFSRDVFHDANEFQFWLSQLSSGGSIISRLLYDISQISDDHKIALEKHKNKLAEKENFKLKEYYFNTPQSSYKNIRINKKLIGSFYETSGELRPNTIHKLSLILKNDFFFDNLSWGWLSRLFNIIKKQYLKTENDSIYSLLTRAVFEKVIQEEGCFEHANSKELSFLFSHISTIDEEYYNEILQKDIIINDIKKRIEIFTYHESDLYLLSHFAFTDWGASIIKHFIETANDIQRDKLIHFHNKVKANNEENLQENTFVYYIYNHFLRSNETPA